MIIAYVDDNDCDFAIKLLDDSKVEQTKKLIEEGMEAWYEAGDVLASNPTEHFTKEQVDSFVDSGYAEPTYELLKRFHIPYEETELQFDENGNVIADEVV